MGVDFNRIDFGISSGTSRNGFGTIVSNPSGGSSFPPAGSYNSTLYGVEYPIAEGGSSVTIQSESPIPIQTCDVIVKNNGSGGTYTDWTTVTNVAYKAYDTLLVTTNYPSGVLGGSVTIWSNTYYTTEHTGYVWYSDGAGGVFSRDNMSSYNVRSGIGTDYVNSGMSANAWVVTIGGSAYNNGKYTDYTASGYQTYYYNDTGSFYSYGTFITSYDGGNYYWDGNGGYYVDYPA
jgi:hypothetical protein